MHWWGGEEDQDLLAGRVEAFKAAYPDQTFDIRVGVESESTAKDTILTDIEAAADVFAFAGDQLAGLVDAGALLSIDSMEQPIQAYAGKSVADIKAANVPASVEAATYNGAITPFPLRQITAISSRRPAASTGTRSSPLVSRPLRAPSPPTTLRPGGAGRSGGRRHRAPRLIGQGSLQHEWSVLRRGSTWERAPERDKGGPIWKINKTKPLAVPFFSNFGTAVARGDWSVKLSLLWMGAGYARRRQYVKALIMTALEAGVVL